MSDKLSLNPSIKSYNILLNCNDVKNMSDLINVYHPLVKYNITRIPYIYF